LIFEGKYDKVFLIYSALLTRGTWQMNGNIISCVEESKGEKELSD
jgi:hypothetical protein